LEVNKSIYTHGGAYWYNDETCKWSRLKHIIYYMGHTAQKYHGKIYSAN